nr:rhodanese-like domain-containing protein [Desulfobulbaceae bacterium]
MMKNSWRLILLLCLAITVGLMAPKAFAADMEQVRQEAKQGGYRLITTNDLRDLIQQNSAGVLLVDTRQDWEYAAGHITGALNFSMEPTWLARLTRRGALEQFLGPDKHKHIVFY